MNKLTTFLNRNSPAIFIGVGVLSTAASIVTAVHATVKAIDILEEDPLVEQEATKRGLELIRKVGRCYIPTIAFGVSGLCCFVGANKVLARRAAAVSLAYSVSEENLKTLKAAIAEKATSKVQQEIKEAYAEKTVEHGDDSVVYVSSGGDNLCYEEYSGRYFNSTYQKLFQIENEVNADILNGEFITLNEVYSKMGLPMIGAGYDIGWAAETPSAKMFEFDTTPILREDNTPALMLSFVTKPGPRW